MIWSNQETNFFLQKKSFLGKGGGRGLNQKRKEGFSTALVTVIKKDPIKKHPNDVNKKEGRQ